MTSRVTVTVSSSTGQLWIKASPRGTRSGFAVLPDGEGGRLTLTVLPKPWSVAGDVVRTRIHEPGTTTHVVMHETEQVAVSTTTAAAGALAMNLTQVTRDQADLIGLGGAPKDPVAEPTVEGDPFGSLLDLVLLAERGSLARSALRFEGAFAPSMLRLLTHERLLGVVEGLVFRARPRYAEHTEALLMPRGRLQEKSLLLSIATGTPRVTSTFDELTMDTPLLQIVASALRVIASDRLPRKVSLLRPGMQARAIQLLRHLSNVTPIERERALIAAERLWLGPLDRIWEPAVEAALPVLRELSIVPEGGTDDTEAMIVHIAMEKFWEQCLQLALESAFSLVAVSRDAEAGEGVNVPAPWVLPLPADSEPSDPPTASFPDFMLRAGRRIVVADAKYKLGVGMSPGASDAYQLFTYSHLAALDDQPSDLAALLYPARSGHRSRQVLLERMRERDYSLWLVHLPFPARRDLRTRASWTAYIAQLDGALRGFAVDWVR